MTSSRFQRCWGYYSHTTISNLDVLQFMQEFQDESMFNLLRKFSTYFE